MATPESVTRDMSPLRQALHRLEDRRAVVLAPDREPCPARPGFRTQARRAPPDPTLAPSAGPEAVSGRFWPFAGESGPVGSFVSATGDPTRPAVPPDSDLIRRIRAARHLWKRARRHLWRPGDPWPAALAVGGTSAPPCNGYDPGVVTAGGFRISLPPVALAVVALSRRARRPRPNRPAGPTGGQSEEFHRRLEKPCASLSARLGRPHARAPYRLAPSSRRQRHGPPGRAPIRRGPDASWATAEARQVKAIIPLSIGKRSTWRTGIGSSPTLSGTP